MRCERGQGLTGQLTLANCGLVNSIDPLKAARVEAARLLGMARSQAKTLAAQRNAKLPRKRKKSQVNSVQG